MVRDPRRNSEGRIGLETKSEKNFNKRGWAIVVKICALEVK